MLSLVSCGSIYIVQNKAAAPATIAAVKTVSVSWIDMNPSNWKAMNFENEKDWSEVITEMNKDGIQKELEKDNNKRKTISFRNPKEGPVNTVDLNIELKMFKYELNYSEMLGGTDQMHTEVIF